ncbi:MAG TPA: ABC transporter permease [Terriglobia bacterium]|nr:ABC transporter permease [Terriglobia bacterium]
MRWYQRLFRRRLTEKQIDAELRFHLEQQIADYVAAGMSPEEARRRSRLEFGGLDQVKEECRDVGAARFVETLIQDLRYGLRQLRRNPGFTAIAVITLALGIGANTAMFSVVDTVLLRALPYKNPSRLVWATERFGFNYGAAGVVSPDYLGWQEHNQVFEQIGASGGGSDANLTGAGQAERLAIRNVTTRFFPMLGVRPILGRTFLPSEGAQGRDHVALLSETLWHNHFGADPHIIGKTIHLDSVPYTVTGVMPAWLHPGTDVWTPFALNEPRFSPRSPRWAILTVIGRLKPGVGVRQAQSNLQVITQQMDRAYPPQASRFRAHERVEVIPLHQLLVQNVRTLLLILLGAVGFVLLIACANVANLQLSRGVARSKEMAIRTALGAGRARLIRQLLTEGFLLAAAGGLIGALAGLWATTILKQLIPPGLPAKINFDPRVLAFSAVIALLAVLLFGFAPAWISSRTEISEAVKEEGLRAGPRAATRLPNLISAVEIALSLILLIGAGLLARSFVSLSEVKLGFEPHGLLLATVERPNTLAAGNTGEYAGFFRNILESVRSLPGVQQAALVSQYPLGPPHNGNMLLNVQGSGQVHPPQVVLVTAISADYFGTMGIRLLKGRAFSEDDGPGAQPVLIINRRLAQILFRNRDPLGQHISLASDRAEWMEVIGVVSATRGGTLEEEPGLEMFVPYLQQPPFGMTLVVRTKSHPELLGGALRKAVQQVDKDQPVFDVVTMDEVIADAMAPRWFKLVLLGLFALLALALAAIGIYGVLSYGAAQRTHEFGIRMALGAQKRDVLRIVLGRGMGLALTGISIGIVGALGLTRFLSSLLYGVTPTDPLTLGVVSLILLGVALLACYIPARRAAKVDPMVALRHE